MDITKFFDMLRDFWSGIFSKLNTTVFTVNGVNVSLSIILFAFLIISIVITVFWGGSRG